MIRVRRLAHVSLKVANLDRSVEFYTEILGLKVSDRGHDLNDFISEFAFLRCDTDHHCIALFEIGLASNFEHVDSGTSRQVGLHHFAFQLESFEELQAAHRELSDRNVPVVGRRVYGPGNQVRLYFCDPDGNRIELYWNLDQIGWDERSRAAPPIEEIDLDRFDLDAFLRFKSGPVVGA